MLTTGVVPMFLTDQLAAYGKALLTHISHWVEKVSEKSERTLRHWMPVEQLQYAQVKKKQRRRKIVTVTTHDETGRSADQCSAFIIDSGE